MNWYLDAWQYAEESGGAAALFVFGAVHLLVLGAIVRTIESLSGKRVPGLHRAGTVHLGKHGLETRPVDDRGEQH